MQLGRMGTLSVRMTGFFSPMKIFEFLSRTGFLKNIKFRKPRKTVISRSLLVIIPPYHLIQSSLKLHSIWNNPHNRVLQ